MIVSELVEILLKEDQTAELFRVHVFGDKIRMNSNGDRIMKRVLGSRSEEIDLVKIRESKRKEK